MFWRLYTFNDWHLFDVMYSFVCTRVLAVQTWFVIRFERASRYRFDVMFLRLNDHFWEAKWVSELQMLWGKHFTFETFTDVLVGDFGPFTVSRAKLTWTFGFETCFWEEHFAVLVLEDLRSFHKVLSLSRSAFHGVKKFLYRFGRLKNSIKYTPNFGSRKISMNNILYLKG